MAACSAAASGYELGHGYPVGDFTLGGYAVADYASADGGQPWRASLDPLSAFLWWDGGGRWRFFSEVELDDALIVAPGATTTDDARVVLERLHLDYAHSDAVQLRLGKFLTPVGRWNEIHAAPLTWTTSRPLITEATFPTNATGAMLHGVLPLTADGVEYALYASPGEELFPDREIDTFTEAWGLRVAATVLPRLQVGTSVANYRQERAPDRKTLWGMDALWAWHRYELSGELAYITRELGDERADERGHYLQFVAPVTERVYAVLRYEGFRASATVGDLSLYLGGVTWRPRSGLALKAEYARATDNDIGLRDGLRASIAVLF
ncbi:hypothetical protein AAG565_03555 [Fontimonas sp. SYSU GA230001]|uniref:hypothetical protein n=1 Tax=Fontimonas sp. SYSU GA230001 TaxID=3142450 RepID=UPI0032B32484